MRIDSKKHVVFAECRGKTTNRHEKIEQTVLLFLRFQLYFDKFGSELGFPRFEFFELRVR